MGERHKEEHLKKMMTMITVPIATRLNNEDRCTNIHKDEKRHRNRSRRALPPPRIPSVPSLQALPSLSPPPISAGLPITQHINCRMSVEEDIRWGPVKDATTTRVLYSSFFNEDVEYKLYENVKVFNYTEEPYIGKIMDLWEEKPTGEKKVLIRWYFKRKELETHAGDPREVFLAFGKGKGVDNENQPDVICSKCLVLCISEAPENRKPTQDELKRAEYFFSKVFDVDSHHVRPVEDVVDELGYDVVYNKKEWITSLQKANKTPQIENRSKNDNDEKNVDQGTQTVRKNLQQNEPLMTFKRKILKELPWEERLEQGIKYGKVLLFQNLDPYMTSANVQELFKSVFQSIIDVRALPHQNNQPYGQAIAIFENKKAADSTLEEMEHNCLVTGDGRSILARRVEEPVKSSRFPGHLMPDKFKHCRLLQTEDYKKAVSTSHCAQPNTIEYEMAMEWRYLQEITRECQQQLFKKQQKELETLKNRNNKKG